jgi:dienelactone hydrolase
MTEQFDLPAPVLKVRGILSVPDSPGKYPCVIISHGLISSKESSKSVALADAFLAAGIASCRFDYHGCGESEGNLRDTTLSIRLRNLQAVVEYVRRQNMIDPLAIGLSGSSFGGSTTLLHAARDKTVRSAILMATPYRLEKRPDDELDQIGFTDIYDDFAKYDLLSEAAGVSHGLVIHGEKDETVPWEEGMAIYQNLLEPKRFELVKGGDHVFSDPALRDSVIRLSVDWVKRFFEMG